jgi:hypothetical protein
MGSREDSNPRSEDNSIHMSCNNNGEVDGRSKDYASLGEREVRRTKHSLGKNRYHEETNIYI